MTVQLTDLNEEFGKALLRQFFEPLLIGRNQDGSGVYAPSGVSLLAQNLFREHSQKIMADIWAQLDQDSLAAKIADQVVQELTRVNNGWGYDRNARRDELVKKVQEIVAQQLGARAVEKIDLQITEKAPDA